MCQILFIALLWDYFFGMVALWDRDRDCSTSGLLQFENALLNGCTLGLLQCGIVATWDCCSLISLHFGIIVFWERCALGSESLHFSIVALLDH